MADLRDVETHFQFGENWMSYAQTITDAVISEAETGLTRLLPAEELAGARMIDIGCGSGLHSLAALRLGAAYVLATDIDSDSAEITRQVLAKYAPEAVSEVRQISLFDLDAGEAELFDVVYSWGVLHHTGDLDAALDKACALVAPKGRLVIALYRRIPLDWFWHWEKQWYIGAGPKSRKLAEMIFNGVFGLGLLAKGRSYRTFLTAYQSKRGMDYHHDVRDWLGGFPYQSISPAEVDGKLSALGLNKVRAFTGQCPMGGLYGSACDEYVYTRIAN